MYGTVAQSVEQRTENPRVGGSIPSRPTSLTHLKLGFCFHDFGINPPLTEERKEILISELH